MTLQIVIAVVTLSASTFGCSPALINYKVSRSFSVRVKNEVGPVTGLKLQVRGDKRAVLAESTTNEKGTAHFNLDKAGQFTLSSIYAARPSDYVGLTVSDTSSRSVVKLAWPVDPLLRTSQLRGRLTNGKSPLASGMLKLRTISDYREVAETRTTQNGEFEFRNVATGSYILQVTPASFGVEGNIVVYVKPDERLDSLNIDVGYGTCGFVYDLEAGKIH